MDKVLKGLSFNAMFAVDYATSYSTSFDNNYAVFIPTWANYGGKDVIVALTKEGNDENRVPKMLVEVLMSKRLHFPDNSIIRIHLKVS